MSVGHSSSLSVNIPHWLVLARLLCLLSCSRGRQGDTVSQRPATWACLYQIPSRGGEKRRDEGWWGVDLFFEMLTVQLQTIMVLIAFHFSAAGQREGGSPADKVPSDGKQVLRRVLLSRGELFSVSFFLSFFILFLFLSFPLTFFFCSLTVPFPALSNLLHVLHFEGG